MADKERYRCIICGQESEGSPPTHCPVCGVPRARWRLLVTRPPRPVASLEALTEGEGDAAENDAASPDSSQASA